MTTPAAPIGADTDPFAVNAAAVAVVLALLMRPPRILRAKNPRCRGSAGRAPDTGKEDEEARKFNIRTSDSGDESLSERPTAYRYANAR
jgi:hypothetical protein